MVGFRVFKGFSCRLNVLAQGGDNRKVQNGMHLFQNYH